MSIEENKQLIREWVRRWNTQDPHSIAELYSDSDFSWRISGLSPISGRFDKPTMLRILGATFEIKAAKPVRFQIRSMTAEGDRVSLEAVALGEDFEGGKKFENFYHFLFELRNGQIVEGRSYFDTYTAMQSPLGKVVDSFRCLDLVQE